MFRYIVRRTLYMIPTVLGVIMITFYLFNIVGGSPAMKKLGKKASAKVLEDYEEQRGLNKPSIAGWWHPTRLYDASGFDRGPGPWQSVKGAVAVEPRERQPGYLSLAAGGLYRVPLEFTPDSRNGYRLVLHYRLSKGAKAWCVGRTGTGGDRSFELKPAGSWKKAVLDFSDGTAARPREWVLVTEGGALDIRALRVDRKMAHVFDSQLWFFLKQIGRLDFGKSYESNQRVSTMLKDGILPSLALAVPIFFVGLSVAISLSLVCAFFRNTFIDRFFVILSVTLMSVNYLVWIIAGQYLLGYLQRWFPIWGFESWKFLVLPVMIGVVSGLGGSLRLYRTVMLDEMYKDYVRTAFAKGVSKRGVLFKHVLKNAMIPVLTNVVMAIPFLYTGNLLLESFFGIPGLGSMGVNAINSADFDVVKALVLIGAVIYVVANLMTDICYAFVDPRVKLR